jgi:hypothetical protein
MEDEGFLTLTANSFSQELPVHSMDEQIRAALKNIARSTHVGQLKNTERQNANVAKYDYLRLLAVERYLGRIQSRARSKLEASIEIATVSRDLTRKTP